VLQQIVFTEPGLPSHTRLTAVTSTGCTYSDVMLCTTGMQSTYCEFLTLS